MNDITGHNPFDALDEIIESSEEKIHIVDFHAEATGEKICYVWSFDGKVSAILGTHTHVQTADNRVYPKGTAFISDVGMTGAYNGIIGSKKEEVIYRTRTGLPARFDVEEGVGQLGAVVLDINEETGLANSIERILITPDGTYGM